MTGDLAPAPGGDAAAVLLSSSGSSGGRPRKAVITHRNLTAGLAQIRTVHRLHPGEVVIAVGPMRHIYGMQMALNPLLRAGGTLLIGPTRFQLARFLDILRDRRVTIAYLVPSVLAEIASLGVLVELPDLRLIVSGGAPLPEPVATECARLISRPVVQGFGMTEAGCISFTPDDRVAPSGTVGVVLPGTEARFVEPETGADAPAGQPGELLARGPQITPGYVDAQGAGLTDEQGWLHTGDLAVRDDDGYLRIVGRLESLIKYKGHQVAPAKLEEVVLSHPAVSDALVVGEPDRVAGEVPKAYVVCASDTSLAEVLEHVAPYEKIRLAQRVRKIPRSSNGKPLRPEPLRALVVEGPDGRGTELAIALDRAGMVVRDAGGRTATAAAAEIGQIDVVFDASGSEAVPRALLAASLLARGGRVVLLVAEDGQQLSDELVERAAEGSISVLGWTSSSIDPPVAVAPSPGGVRPPHRVLRRGGCPGTHTGGAVSPALP
ncbi:AMP-binding protein [Lentzea sp. NPDC059081]|uniref:AMP-binding protein n=1 Tax=Lentzea sp. NPDC059081 TaxID=3346719 RepID=UPI0036CBAE23